MKGKIQRGVVCLIAALGLLAAVPAFADSNLAFRYEHVLSKDLAKDWGMYVYQEFNFDKDPGHNLTGQAHELGFVYSGFADWFDLIGSYCKYYGKSAGKWMEEDTPFVVGVVKWKMMNIDMSNSSRIEFNKRRNASDRWRYRNTIALSPDIQWTKLEVSPFLTDEIFYDMDEEYVSANELKVGVKFKVTKNSTGRIYYLLAHSHSRSTTSSDDEWHSSPILGIGLTANF